MKWRVTENNKPLRIYEIPVIPLPELREEIISQCKSGKRVLSFFGIEKGKSDIQIFTVLADDPESMLYISSAIAGDGESYESITPAIPAFDLFEREFYEDTGKRHSIVPLNHPWLKPVRKNIDDYNFFSMSGEEIHEVAVGPIHAGVIEPGHFRFMCSGEKVHHLEIALGYQHRGIENIFLQENILNKITLAESISGDSSIGHSTAYLNAVESLGNIEIPEKAQIIRAIALELERIANHIGDLSALANDVAYQIGYAVYGARRTLIINSSQLICGNRFGRGLMRPGGVNFDINSKQRETIKKTLKKVYADLTQMSEVMFADPSVRSRFEMTGVLDNKKAVCINLVGPAARASGIIRDIRANHPFGIYGKYKIEINSYDTGDVFARAMIRYSEIRNSINYILKLFALLDDGISITDYQDSLKIAENSIIVSLVEGWRGEIAHIVLTDKNGKILRYKIKDPSFNNWLGLALAVRHNGVSDFPLCNKSFNLSYCGFDL